MVRWTRVQRSSVVGASGGTGIKDVSPQVRVALVSVIKNEVAASVGKQPAQLGSADDVGDGSTRTGGPQDEIVAGIGDFGAQQSSASGVGVVDPVAPGTPGHPVAGSRRACHLGYAGRNDSFHATGAIQPLNCEIAAHHVSDGTPGGTDSGDFPVGDP